MFVTGSLPQPARHSLVWLAEKPLNPAAAEHWSRGLPFVLCRRREGEEVSLGYCLPSGNAAKPSRHALAAKWSDVGMLTRPPLLREVAAALPLLKPLLPITNRRNPRVVGSSLWEYLTKVPYLRQPSDFDLVWDLQAGEDPERAVEFFQKADALLANRVDGEIHFPDFGEVAWREWASDSRQVVVKSPTEVALIPREKLVEAQKADCSRSSPLADSAVEALIEELELYPKPGLVSRHDSGSHNDMDYALMRKSAESLHGFFAEIEGSPGDFQECLKPVGLRAEQRMLEVTVGVNTHRGAIFLLGLLIAAASRTHSRTPAAIQECLLLHYGPALVAHKNAIEAADSHGARVRQVTGSSGARGEASLGFPAVFEVAFPHFETLRAQGVCRQLAALETLLLLISQAADSNLVHRGGVSGAALARESAGHFLAEGGVRNPAWFQNLQNLHRQFVQERLSPGGCADLLAAVLFLDRVGLIAIDK